MIDNQNTSRLLHKDFIFNSVYNQIKDGTLKPGERITEMQLAKKFGMSQAPAREALRELESFGLVEIIPYKGNYIRKFTLKELKDNYRVRAGLEMIGVEDCIKKITDEEIAELGEILNKMNEAGKLGMVDDFVDYDVAFHEYFMDKADNQELMNAWQRTHIKTWTALNTSISNLSQERLAHRHTSIYEAIKKRDSNAAVKEVKSHLESLTNKIRMSDEDELFFEKSK